MVPISIARLLKGDSGGDVRSRSAIGKIMQTETTKIKMGHVVMVGKLEIVWKNK